MNGSFPRVLVISGYTFSQKSGGSITMSNLFRGWPKDRLAIVDADRETVDSDICVKRYPLFPAKVKDEPIVVRSTAKHRLAKALGLAGGVFPLRISKELVDFVESFKPDVIYTQASQLSYMWLTQDMLRLTDAKLVYHIMDDFPKTTYTQGWLSYFPRLLMKKLMGNLIKNASGVFGISDGMCSEYKSRYGRDFLTFHNPVEIEDWNEVLDEKVNSAGLSRKRFSVAYSGRIGLGAKSSIVSLIEAVRVLNESGLEVDLYLYTHIPSSELEISRRTSLYKEFVYLREGPRSISELKGSLRSSDLLVLPIDFDEESVSFLKLSMPTKLPAYMMSGVPILVYGPVGVHSVDFVKSTGVGVACVSPSVEALAGAIKSELTSLDEGVRRAVSARQYAESNYLGSIVREKFRHSLHAASICK